MITRDITRSAPTFPLETINDLCQRVKLERVEALPTYPEITPPETCVLWKGTYACVLLWPVTQSDPAGLRRSATQGQEWFDHLLSEEEGKGAGRVIDGYLILLLASAADEELIREARRIEVSTQACRKHVVWPETAADDSKQPTSWHGIMNIAVLALPHPPAAATDRIGWPALDEEASSVWNAVRELGHAEAARREIEQSQ